MVVRGVCVVCPLSGAEKYVFRLVLSGCGLPGHEAGEKETGREWKRGGYRKRGMERFTCENSGGFVMAIV